MDRSAEKLALRRFLRFTLLLSWGVGGVYLAARTFAPSLQPLGENVALLAFMACAPSLAALLCAWREGALGTLGQTLFRPFNLIWLLVALALLPILAAAIAFAAHTSGVPWAVDVDDALVRLPLLLFTTTQIITNVSPIGEELGWRGYALPRLLRLTSPLRASLVLGAVWCVWHLPAFFLGGLMAPGGGGFVWWCMSTLALTAIMTWLYLRANGNVIVAGIAPHFVINGAGAVGVWLARPAEACALAGLALIIVLTGGLRATRVAVATH